MSSPDRGAARSSRCTLPPNISGSVRYNKRPMQGITEQEGCPWPGGCAAASIHSHLQWLHTAQRGELSLCLPTVPSSIWQGYFLICSLFIPPTPRLNTLYAAQVLITTQFFIYIPVSFTLPMKWHRAWGRAWLTCFHTEVLIIRIITSLTWTDHGGVIFFNPDTYSVLCGVHMWTDDNNAQL